jgi:tRNA dimethylallyltransferase
MSLLLTIIGPTASGKTQLAVQAALALDGEVISADSRQVYRGMDLGTGKDLGDYTVEGRTVPYHLIDIREPGYKYSIYEYQADCHRALADIAARGKTPILCGGSGLYVESVLKGYEMHEVPENPELRTRLASKSLEELAAILATYKTLHNQTDTDTCKRAIREIEIREYYRTHAEQLTALPPVPALVVGVNIDRDLRRERIARRLRQRLDEGMVDEVRHLLDSGLQPEALIYYGLEYKYLTLHVTGQINYDTMVEELQTAIFQFAKRQMTWFRGMERRGIPIRWVDYAQPLEARAAQVVDWYREASK